MRRLTLSFDNGPTPGVTEQVLSVLDRYGVPASFFMVGERLKSARGIETARRVKAAGHRVGNHTMTHGVPLGRRREPDHAEREIGDTEKLIGALAEPSPLFRPNGGGVSGPHLLSESAAAYLAARGYTVVTWNSVPRDWEKPSDAWIGRALEDIDRREWTLLVLHDIESGAMEHLPRFLDAVSGKVAWERDFPPECLPMVGGVAQPGLDAIVTRRTG
jgi:peptidoglycan/xylan/chitin deacetylase (PgdA/CDA1 family)